MRQRRIWKNWESLMDIRRQPISSDAVYIPAFNGAGVREPSKEEIRFTGGTFFQKILTYGIIRCHYCFSGDNTIYPGVKKE